MSAVGVLCVAVLAAAEASPLSLQLSAAMERVFVGEPTKFEVVWSVTEPHDIRPEKAQVLMADGDSFRPWVETWIGGPTTVEWPLRRLPGSIFRTAFVISATGQPDRGNLQLAFPSPGSYRVMVLYRNRDEVVNSNVVSMTVISPSASDLELLNVYIRPHPEIVTPWLRGANRALLPSLFARYGSSRYLARSKVIWFEDQLAEAIAAEPDPPRPGDPIGGEVPGLLASLALEDLGDNPFEQDRLILLADMTERSNRNALPIWLEIVARYPNSVAEQIARGRIGERR